MAMIRRNTSDPGTTPAARGPTGGANEGASDGETQFLRRIKYGLSVAVLMLSLVVVLGVISWLTATANIRWDLTAGRAWSLSPQTKTLLAQIDETGERIDIVLLFDAGTPGVADLERQVQDVLQEYVGASDRLNIIRIDPTNPADEAGPLALVLERLRGVFAADVAAYEAAIDNAQAALGDLSAFARAEAKTIEAISGRTSAQTEVGLVLRRLRDLFAGMPFDLQQTTAGAAALLEPEEGATALPQWTLAVAQYRAAMRQPADTLRQAAGLFREYIREDAAARERARAEQLQRPGETAAAEAVLDAAVVEWLQAAAPRYEALADVLDAASETIAELPRLRLESIVREIRESRSVLLLSETNATLLSFERLFPAPSATEIATGQRIDRRFAGEQVLASGLYELTQDARQVVVFVHAENRPGGILRGEAGAPDVLVAAGLLRDLGFEVLTWNLREQAERPEVDTTGGPAVWVLVPPPAAVGGGGEAMQAGLQMLAAAEDLIADGARVMLNVHPSTLPSLGQSDPWQDVLAKVGIRPATGTVIYQQIAGTGGRRESVPALTLREYRTDQPIGRAVNGLETYFEAPIPLEAVDPNAPAATPGGAGPAVTAVVETEVVLDVERSATLWPESEWFAPREHQPPADAAAQASGAAPLPLVMTATRGIPGGAGGSEAGEDAQRLMVVGSGGWFYSDILGARQQINQNLFIRFPGNADLFTNGCLWLAGRDRSIASGSFARSAPRIEGLDAGEALAWRWLLIAVLPLASLLAGTVVWFLRRG